MAESNSFKPADADARVGIISNGAFATPTSQTGNKKPQNASFSSLKRIMDSDEGNDQIRRKLKTDPEEDSEVVLRDDTLNVLRPWTAASKEAPTCMQDQYNNAIRAFFFLVKSSETEPSSIRIFRKSKHPE